MAISEEFEGIGCLSTEGTQRKDNSTIVQPLLYYITPLLFAHSTIIAVSLLVTQRVVTEA